MYRLGDIILLNFPYTGFVGAKKRPALVILDAKDGDVLVSRITSKSHHSDYDLTITDWKGAGLISLSYVRLHKLATLENTLIERKLGALSPNDLADLKLKITEIAQNL